MKKNLSVEMPGVAELGLKELKETNGGIIPFVLGGLLSGIVGGLIAKQGSVGSRHITDDEYVECFESCTGVEYPSGW